MKALRTPDERFRDLSGYPFAPHYVLVDDGEGGQLRTHYVEEGPAGAPTVLMLHGEPSWSYLYRTLIPIVVSAGYRAIAPDLIGFGRSDKPSARSDYTYQRHVDWLRSLLLGGITPASRGADPTRSCSSRGCRNGSRFRPISAVLAARAGAVSGRSRRGLPALARTLVATAAHVPALPPGTCHRLLAPVGPRA